MEALERKIRPIYEALDSRKPKVKGFKFSSVRTIASYHE